MYRRYSIVSMLVVLLLALGLYVNYNKQNKSLVISHESGFYDEEFKLSLKCPRGGTIYYTLDSSEPSKASTRYTESILISDASNNDNVYSNNVDMSVGYQFERASKYGVSLKMPWYKVPDFKVDKCTVVKACFYDRFGRRSETTTRVFFVGFAEKEGYENLYFLSISCNPESLFDYDNGIYVCGVDMDDYLSAGDIAPNWAWWIGNYSRKHKKSEKDAHAVLFSPCGEPLFDKHIGIRIQGNSSRAYMPKSLNLFSRVEYDGTNHFPDVFENGYEAHALNLFTGSQDYCTKVRDAVVNNLSDGMDVSSRKYKPVVLFLNGEYWGVYFLTEKYDEDYFKWYYNQNKDNIVFVKNDYLEAGDRVYLEQYRSLMEFVRNNDMSLEDNYQYISRYIDMKSYADYYAIMIYVGRYNDWPTGNIATWRVEEASEENETSDGRWRYCLFDLNSGCLDIRFLEHDSIEYVMEMDSAFANLCNNSEFVNLLCESLVDVMENSYTDEKIKNQMNYYKNLLLEPMKMNNQRFFGTDNYTDSYEYLEDGETFEEKLSSIEYYMLYRKAIIYKFMEAHFGYQR